MPDLRETLARQLESAATEGTLVAINEGYGIGTQPYEDALFRAVADECIRQMEWARRGTIDSRYDIPLHYHDLTAAPEGWEVPK